MFKKTPLALVLISAITLTACNSSEQPEQAVMNNKEIAPSVTSDSNNITSKAVATVNGQDLSEHTLTAYMKQRLAQVPESDTPSARRQILEEAINMELAIQDALNKKLDQNPAVATELETQRRNILASAAFGNYLKENPKTDGDLKKIYEERMRAENFQDYKVRHILADSEDAAKDLISKLDKGADFVDLAKASSTGPSAAQGGDLGWLNSNDILPEILTSIQKLDKGKYTSTPVKTQFGWHIVKLDDVKQIPMPSFEKVRQELVTIAQREMLENYLVELRANANVVIHDKFVLANDALKETVESK